MTYFVHKPTPHYRKSAPGPPDFRIAVVDAREVDVLTLRDFDALLRDCPLAPPPESMNAQMFQRLKHGWRNVVLAVVDAGIVSYLRVGDAAFGKEKLWERYGHFNG